MKRITTKVNIYKEGSNPFFSESVTGIELDDEAGGIFFKITQSLENDLAEIRLDVNEIDIFCETLQEMKKIAEPLVDADE